MEQYKSYKVRLYPSKKQEEDTLHFVVGGGLGRLYNEINEIKRARKNESRGFPV